MSDSTMTDNIYELQRKREADAVQRAFKRLMVQEQEQGKLNDGSNTIWGRTVRKEIILDVIAILEKEEKDAQDPNMLITNEVLKRASEATNAVKDCVGIDLVNKKTNDKEDLLTKKKETRNYFDLKQAAFIAVQLTLVNALAPKTTSKIQSRTTGDWKTAHEQKTLTQLADKIGRVVENEMWYSMMSRNLPAWHKAIHEFAMKGNSKGLNSSTAYYENTISNLAARKAAQVSLGTDPYRDETISILAWRAWTRKQRIHVGRWLMRAVLLAAERKGLFTAQETLQDGKTAEYIRLGVQGEQFRDELLASTKDHCWENIPMICPPVDHTKKQVRGYLAKAAWHRPPSKEGVLLLSDEHLAFVNRLQQVAYRLNPFVVEVMELLADKEIELGKFCPISYKEPATVAHRLGYGSISDYDEQTNLVINDPSFHEAKKQRGIEIGEQKFIISSGNAANTRGLLRVMDTVKDQERFYIPTYWDFRGRVYYTVPFLNPQAYDPGKGVLQFADSTPVDDRTSHYLKLSISTALGFDKLSYEDRVDKVDALEDQITNVALILTDRGDFPKAMGFLGQMKDDVWEGLAACEEYYWCCLAPKEQRRTHTHYRCALDATAQGAQLVSGFRRSQAGAAKVNLLPCPKPNDVYLNLWKELVDVVCHDGSVRPKILKAYKELGYGRKLAKSGILMSAQYGSGISKQIAEFKAIHEAIDAEYRLTEDELALFIGTEDHRPFTIALERATSIAAYVNWMRKVTDKVLKSGRRHFAVPTVNGNLCLMRYPKRKKREIKTFHHSSINLNPLDRKFVHKEKTPNPNPKDLAKATSANAIHAQDAALLSHAYYDWSENISTVHDSIVSAPGRSMDRLAAKFVEAFVETISWGFWEAVYDANKLEHDSNIHDAVIGDLDIDKVRQANYLVC